MKNWPYFVSHEGNLLIFACAVATVIKKCSHQFGKESAWRPPKWPSTVILTSFICISIHQFCTINLQFTDLIKPLSYFFSLNLCCFEALSLGEQLMLFDLAQTRSYHKISNQKWRQAQRSTVSSDKPCRKQIYSKGAAIWKLHCKNASRLDQLL